eukprot:TRINITY_DN1409_c0_g1_i2.p1 TRINITY_DN1409_c0_g1~~TRINITY_DN1409_c0_g1_i2.p1  ORF type:complete len:116 (+),score=18.73 TRINITY_DN1409_c0_g1_i2:236-583(+)
MLRECLSKSLGFNNSKQALRFITSSRLFVGGLSFRMDEQSLREAFVKFGVVTGAKIIYDRRSGKSKGCGFVSFLTPEEASVAKTEMDGKELHGRSVRVNHASEVPGGHGAARDFG